MGGTGQAAMRLGQYWSTIRPDNMRLRKKQEQKLTACGWASVIEKRWSVLTLVYHRLREIQKMLTFMNKSHR